MADSFIQLPSDSTGKQLDTAVVNMGAGTTQVHREKIVVSDPASTSGFATVTSSQGLQVSSTQAQTISGTVTVLNASSGITQILSMPTISTSGLRSFSAWSTGSVVVTNITTAQTMLSGWAIYNSTASIRSVKIYNTTGPTAGNTVGLICPVTIPGSTGGGGSNLSLTPYGVFTSNGISLIVTANSNATDTGAPGANDVAWTVFYI